MCVWKQKEEKREKKKEKRKKKKEKKDSVVIANWLAVGFVRRSFSWEFIRSEFIVTNFEFV